jgi:hypothetical protein
MAAILLPQQWNSQPQIPVGPNKGTKFGQTCFALWSAISPALDLARAGAATSWVQGSPPFTVGPYGRSLSDDSGTQNALVTLGGSLTTTVPFSFTTVSVLRAFSGSNSTTFLQLGSSTAGVAIGHDSSKQMYISFGNGRGSLYMDTPGYITAPNNDTDWFVVATSWQEPSNGRMVIYNLTTGTWKEATGTYGVGDWAAPGLNGTYTVGDSSGAGFQKYTRFVLNAASFGSSTSGELRSLCANPWQVFTPLPRRIFVSSAAGGGSVGTATVVFGATGATSSLNAQAGSSAVVFGATAASQALSESTGTSTVVFGATGGGASTTSGQSTGTASFVFDATGTSSSLNAAAGSSTVVFGASGVGSSSGAISATGTASFTFNASSIVTDTLLTVALRDFHSTNLSLQLI